MALAKIYGEDSPSSIANGAKHRTELLCEVLKLKRRSMPHHSTYLCISEEVIHIEKLEKMINEVLSGKRYFGKLVLLAIDEKVL